MGIHTFLNVVSLEVNVIALLEFELTYDDVTVEHISHYATWTLP